MLTDRQRMQVKKAIGHRHGLLPETVDLTDIHNVPNSTIAWGKKVEIKIDFSHPTGYWGSETFLFDPTDLRKSPFLMKGANV